LATDFDSVSRSRAPAQAFGDRADRRAVDGVFAIVLTLLVLDLHTQHASGTIR
jgi:hypothetical protein